MANARIKNRLWSARKETGLSQSDVAFLLEQKSNAQISRWEKGRRVPNTRDLMKLSAIYHRLANDLMFDLYQDSKRQIEHRFTLLHQNHNKI